MFHILCDIDLFVICIIYLYFDILNYIIYIEGESKKYLKRSTTSVLKCLLLVKGLIFRIIN